MKSKKLCAVLALSCLSAAFAQAMDHHQSQLKTHYVYRVQNDDVIDLMGKHVLQYDFSSVVLRDSVLNKSFITGSNFNNTQIKGGSFQDAMIRESQWKKSQIWDANFSCSAIVGSRRHHITLMKSHVIRTNMQNMAFTYVDMRETNITDTNLSHATFRHVNMENAMLENVDLRNSNFRYANLKGVRFRNVDLRGAKFERTRLRGAKIFDEKSQSYRSLRGVDLLRAGASHAGFVAAVTKIMTTKTVK